jgi:hypothetical protein
MSVRKGEQFQWPRDRVQTTGSWSRGRGGGTRTWVLLPVLAAVLSGPIGSAAESAPDAPDGVATVQFDRDVRPILSDKCFVCHGPDSSRREAGLRLDVRAEALAPLDSDLMAIVPGDPEASELMRRVTSEDEYEVMPPPEAKLEPLTPREIELLRRWIAEGAEYEAHWAFRPLDAPPVPDWSGDLPAGARVRNPIDQIVFAGLTARGLTPQSEADRRTLIRRVSLDLLGLPPTPEEVRAFVEDPDPAAYERLVDRLLQSPHYGERMAVDWLDLARYADSYGFQVDRERDMWPYRDWVIRAFNENLPWDQFVTWQLAGDLLPESTDEQILATAFNRLHQQEAEGGSIEEEYRVNHVNDRVVTFGTAMLGLTLDCARCHDHKFDPISQKEYYQLFAFFQNIDEAGLYSYFTNAVPTPTLWLLDESRKRELAEAREAIERAEAELAERALERTDAFARWLAELGDTAPELPDELARFDFDQRDASGKFPSRIDDQHSASAPDEIVLVPGIGGNAIRLTGDHAVTTTLGNFARSDPFSVALWLKTPRLPDRTVIFHRSRAWTDAGSRGYELLLEDGRLKWSLIHFWPGNAISIRATEPIAVDEWVHVAVTSDGSSRADGLSLYVNGRRAGVEVVRDGLTREVTGGGGDTIAIGERFRDRGFEGGTVDEFRVFARALTPLDVAELHAPGSLSKLLRADESAVSADRREELRTFYLSGHDAKFRQGVEALRAARGRQSQLAESVAEIMVMRELPEPRPAYVLKRGEYHLRQEAVEAGTPAALPPFPDDQPRNRLGLARWLTDPRHPLLARVTVNRFWQACFGRGLVKTAEDFGVQGDRPEYPALLDWLASDLVRSGWDVKHLMRAIVTSHTYRQRSFSTPDGMADDPDNVYLARGPRHRLPAEMIRDNILSSSGLLVPTVGGPPVRTYDLPESFKPAAAGTGDELYRRSLYTFWRRTGPAPALEAFDVPNRVVCVARRDSTNTPLHALVLLNGTQFVEAARVLAERLYREAAGEDTRPIPDRVLREAFARLTSRPPDAQETEILQRMYVQQRDWYDRHPTAAEPLLALGEAEPDPQLPAVEIAALANVIGAIMNYDGCVVKR